MTTFSQSLVCITGTKRIIIIIIIIVGRFISPTPGTVGLKFKNIGRYIKAINWIRFIDMDNAAYIGTYYIGYIGKKVVYWYNSICLMKKKKTETKILPDGPINY